MDLQVVLVCSLLFIQSGAVLSYSPTNQTPTKTKQTQPVVYTAETARQSQTLVPSSAPTTETNENLGFVQPIDFSSFTPNADFGGIGSKTNGYGHAPNPKASDLFPGFFNNDESSSGNSYTNIEDPYRSLTSSASNHNSRKDNGESIEGFVDPSVQFRSLFDAAGTSDGFAASDFLDYKNENSRDGSSGSSNKAYPSFTYSGRQDSDEQEDEGPKFRATFRHVENTDPYADSRKEYEKAHAPLRRQHRPRDDNRQKEQPNQFGSSSEETADSPQASSPGNDGKIKSDTNKSKCKKVEKEVDYEEEYNEYNPVNYDPSSYQSRYKRQAGRGGNKRNKRPMTCFVCEDEHGRYAERCSYDSNSDPKKGSYFHSSSTSFTDNGRPKGGRDRHRRNPEFYPYPLRTVELTPGSDTESLPKRIQKRQSEGNRYASSYQDKDGLKNNFAHRIGYDDPESRDDLRGQGQGNREDSDFNYSPVIDIGEDEERGNEQQNPNRQGENFEFGPPSNFGRNNEPERENSRGFGFDFSIPREFQETNPGTSNTHDRPIFSGSKEFGSEFDIGYDDYVKQHFPETFERQTSGQPSNPQPRPTGSSAPSPPSYQNRGPPNVPYGNSASPDGPSYSPGELSGGSGPNKGFHHPPRNFYTGVDDRGPEHLAEAINQFNQKDRKDCEKVTKNGMTCYICRDPRGMKKEECMYSSSPGDQRGRAMAYHSSSEYSSQPSTPHSNKPIYADDTGESKIKEVIKPTPDYDFDY